MPDSRIKEFIDEYHKSYLVAYQVKPMISGKEAKRVQDMWAWADKESVEQIKVYDALNNYFNDPGFVKEQAHPLELFFKGIIKYMQPAKKTQEQHGKEMIEKAKVMFCESQKRIDEKLKVETKTENDLLAGMAQIYPNKDHEDALRWAKGHRWNLESSGMIKEGQGVLFARWKAHGELARKYFGNELINRVWRESKPLDQAKPSLSDVIKKAKEIEQNG